MAIAATFTKVLTAASPSNICQSQTPLAAGDLTLNGATAIGVPKIAVLDTQRRVLITPAGAESARSFTIWGTNDSGAAIVEVVAGVNNPSTATSLLDFKTVTRIAVDAATAGALTVGTNGVGGTPWYVPDRMLTPMNIGIGIVVTPTLSGEIQYTYDSPNSGLVGVRANNAATAIPNTYTHSTLVAVTSSTSGSITAPVFGVRWVTNSGTGTAAIRFIQSGLSQ